MNRTRWAIVGGTVALGLFLFFGGVIVVLNGTPYTYTVSSWTGEWGLLPALLGLVLLGATALVVWDASR